MYRYSLPPSIKHIAGYACGYHIYGYECSQCCKRRQGFILPEEVEDSIQSHLQDHINAEPEEALP